jgi:hypothetical protein
MFVFRFGLIDAIGQQLFTAVIELDLLVSIKHGTNNNNIPKRKNRKNLRPLIIFKHADYLVMG